MVEEDDRNLAAVVRVENPCSNVDALLHRQAGARRDPTVVTLRQLDTELGRYGQSAAGLHGRVDGRAEVVAGAPLSRALRQSRLRLVALHAQGDLARVHRSGVVCDLSILTENVKNGRL